MRSSRSLAGLLAGSLLVAGCGLGATPAVGSQDEVVDALLALGDGAEGRLTAVLAYDEGEVRDALRGDAEARALLEEELGDADVEALLEELATTRDRLADHAVLLGTGADGSGRVAAEYRGRVWVDLRASSDLGDDPAGEERVDLQARVDWTTVSELLEEPDLLGDLDELATEVVPFLDALPETDAVQRVLLGLLGGELVAISGEVGPELLDGLASLTGTPDRDPADLRALDLDPRQVLTTALAFDGFRTDGDDTLVDVHLELRAAAELVLARVAAAPAAFGTTPEDVADAQARLADLPARLDGVALLRLDADGTVQQVRADVLDVAMQLARAVDAEDPALSAAERLAAELDATGLFVLLDVSAVGATPTVLGDPIATATPEEVVRAVGGVLFGGLAGGLGEAALQDLLDDADA